jgi:hypothetical protein
MFVLFPSIKSEMNYIVEMEIIVGYFVGYFRSAFNSSCSVNLPSILETTSLTLYMFFQCPHMTTNEEHFEVSGRVNQLFHAKS